MQEVGRAGASPLLGLQSVKIFVTENEFRKQCTCGMIVQIKLCTFLLVSLSSSTLACFSMEAHK